MNDQLMFSAYLIALQVAAFRNYHIRVITINIFVIYFIIKNQGPALIQACLILMPFKLVKLCLQIDYKCPINI